MLEADFADEANDAAGEGNYQNESGVA
jgi:hypothetical protein